MTRRPDTPDCSVKGCTRAAHKGLLCAKHYRYVPAGLKMETMLACASAAAMTARKYHRKQLAHVNRYLSATGGTEAS